MPARYRIGNTHVESFAFDLNRNGLFLETDILADRDSVFPIGLTIPSSKESVEGFARVVYRNEKVDEPGQLKSRGMGIELLDCMDHGDGLIQSYLAEIPTVKSPDRTRIVKVETSRDLERFIDLPYSLYRGNRFWIPPLKRQMRDTLTDGNPFLKHGEIDLFLALDGKDVVGRIGAIVDHDYISLYRENIGAFGFFECIPDFGVAIKLFGAVEANLRTKGMEKIRGPMNPSLNDEICFLAEGFDSSPNIMMPYNPPYYNNFARGFGMDKAKDFLSLWVNLKRDLPKALIDRLARTEADGVRFRKFDMKRYDEEIELLRRLNNQSWTDAGNWGFVPITSDEMELISAHFKQIADPDIIYFAEIAGETAGYVINLPNFFPALRVLDGKTSPLGILRFLLRLKRIKNVRAVSVGVLDGYGGRNIALSLFIKSVLEMQKKGYESMEYVWVVEDNEASLRIVSRFGGRHYKRYRMYEYTPV